MEAIPQDPPIRFPKPGVEPCAVDKHEGRKAVAAEIEVMIRLAVQVDELLRRSVHHPRIPGVTLPRDRFLAT